MPEPFVVDGVWIPKAIVGIRSRFAVPLYLELRKHCFETPTCFPGVRRLARLVGCAIGTVSALTNQFAALGVITKLHTGRHCVYRFAEGCWRRRKRRGNPAVFKKPMVSAHRSVSRTEDRSNFVESTDKEKSHTKIRVSPPAASAETRNKRMSMIRSLRRWCELSPALPDSERPHRLGVLDRAEAALDDWCSRSREDRACFELLVTRSKARPLDGACVQSLRQRPPGMSSIAAFLPVLGSMPADPPAGSPQAI
jgi:hypothetical protein